MKRTCAVVIAFFSFFFLSHVVALAQSDDTKTKAVRRTSTTVAKKVALIMGNKDYPDTPLMSPVNDAQDISRSLTRLGFTVTTKTNLNQKDFEEAIRQFSREIKDADVALFYFSGHGCQVKGENYLVPVGYVCQSEADIRFKTVNAGFVLEQMDQQKDRDRINIIILDACRNNRFKGFKSLSRGLTAMDAPSGTFIAYATAPGTEALDGRGRNSVYTKHLLAAIEAKGLAIEQAFKTVTRKVKEETDNKQVPWISSSLIKEFWFDPAQEVPNDLANLRKRGEAGDADAQFELGVKCEYGLGVSENLEEAKNWYSKASTQGNKKAQAALARLNLPEGKPAASIPVAPSPSQPAAPFPTRTQAETTKPAKHDPSKDGPLLDAAKNGDLPGVKRLLSEGADPNARNKDGYTALMAASEKGDVDIVNVLMYRGADVNSVDKTGNTALMIGASRGQDKVVTALLEKGANVNYKDKEGETPLVRVLAGRTSPFSHPLLSKILLDKGADPNARDKKGDTALMRAAINGHGGAMKELLQKGVDVNARDDRGQTVLTKLIAECPERGRRGTDILIMVPLLLDNGADINLRYENGETALMKLITSNPRGSSWDMLPDYHVKELAELFLKKGADVNATDEFGQTAFSAAKRYHDDPILRNTLPNLLKKYGAK
jgi:ankyrin repeat protein